MDDDEDLSCTAEEDIEMATYIAKKYGCRFEIIDLQKRILNNK